MLQVELDIFSGRPNPRWTLTEGEEKTLVDQVTADKSMIFPVGAAPGILGYRGFIVRSFVEGDGPAAKAGLPTQFRLVTAADPDPALFMLDTSESADSEVDDYLRGVVQQSIVEAAERKDPSTEGPGMSCYSNYLTSSTDFSFWNGSPHVYQNNCYNYASNYRSGSFAQPGTLGGSPVSSSSDCYCHIVGPKVRSDGYSDYCLGGSARNISIALVIWPGVDFHFYRLCTNGRWCHKAGQTPATNKDNSNNYIYNPQTCDRGYYTDFCEYFYADSYRPV